MDGKGMGNKGKQKERKEVEEWERREEEMRRRGASANSGEGQSKKEAMRREEQDMGNKGKQRERKEGEEWERREEEMRGRGAFSNSALTRRSPQQKEEEEAREKRKVGETSFEEGDERKRERREWIREEEGGEGQDRALIDRVIREMRREREEWYEKLEREREEWRKEVERMREAWREEVREMKETWRKEILDMKEAWKEERDSLKERIRCLEEEKEKGERKEKRDNIVVRGKSFVNKEEVETFIKEALKVEVKVRECYKVEGGNGMTVVKMEGREDKIRIMKNKKLLKGQGSNIFIDDDLTKKEREIQKNLRERAFRERNKGKKAWVGYQKLVVEDRVWRWCKNKGDLEEEKKNE